MEKQNTAEKAAVVAAVPSEPNVKIPDLSKQLAITDAIAAEAIKRKIQVPVIPVRLSRQCDTPWTIAECLQGIVTKMHEAGYNLMSHSLNVTRTSTTTVDELVIAVFELVREAKK